ncbi:dienelactone hydrolase family protein [Planctomycetota bacterium]
MEQGKLEPSDAGIEQTSDRREFLKQCAALSGCGIAACVILPDSEVKAEGVAPNDPRLSTERVSYPIQNGQMKAYLARPKKQEKLPAVIVIHENRGLNVHIEDVARRLALQGFLVIAPDALSPLGGTPADTNAARDKMRELDREATVNNYVAAVQYLKTHPQTTGKVGCTGFCWGGAMTNQVAVNAADLQAAVPYYGSIPAEEDVPKIKAALMCHYAGEDTRINRGIPEFEAALKKAGIDYTIYMYEGAQHAFNNDTNAARYHKEAAELAWQRTVAFFKEKLQSSADRSR